MGSGRIVEEVCDVCDCSDIDMVYIHAHTNDMNARDDYL